MVPLHGAERPLNTVEVTCWCLLEPLRGDKGDKGVDGQR